MRLFILKILRVFFLSILLLFLYLYVISEFLGSRLDQFYVKLVSPTKYGLILGDSRALMGVDPEFLTPRFDNFAFTITHSPYDKSYLNLIAKKVSRFDSFDLNRKHIVCVSPWALLTNVNDTTDRNLFFSENLRLPLMNPNIEYLFKYVDLSFLNLINIIRTKSYTKGNGCYKYIVSKKELSLEYNRRVRDKIADYRSKYNSENLNLKSSRVQNLNEIIKYLQKSGKVYLVRLPISKEILKLEKEKFPGFDILMTDFCRLNNIDYINLSFYHFKTVDGNHLWFQESKRLGETLSAIILKKN